MSDEEMLIYTAMFAKTGVEVKSFITLVRKGRWRDYAADTTLIEDGQPLTKVVLLTDGKAAAYKPKQTVPVNIYSGINVKEEEAEGDGGQGSLMRGPLVGSTRLVD